MKGNSIPPTTHRYQKMMVWQMNLLSNMANYFGHPYEFSGVYILPKNCPIVAESVN